MKAFQKLAAKAAVMMQFTKQTNIFCCNILKFSSTWVKSYYIKKCEQAFKQTAWAIILSQGLRIWPLAFIDKTTVFLQLWETLRSKKKRITIKQDKFK